MSDPGPLPEPKRRRRLWLWIIVGILGFCIIACVAVSVWASTDTGQRILNDAGTSFAETATEQAEP